MTYSTRLQQRKTELEAAIANSSFKEWIVEYAAVLQALGLTGTGGTVDPGNPGNPTAEWQTHTISFDYDNAANGTVEHRQIVPANKEWQIIAGSAKWACSLGSASRSLAVFLNAEDALLFESLSVTEGLGAGKILQYNFGVAHPGSVATSVNRTVTTVSIPPLILKSGESIVLWQNGAQQNDSFEARIRVMERSV